MNDSITIVIDDETIKFTPEGKIDVLDAITSLSGTEDEHKIWESLVSQRPELKDLCEPYHFSPQVPAIVTDIEGWEMIQSALFDYILLANAQ